MEGSAENASRWQSSWNLKVYHFLFLCHLPPMHFCQWYPLHPKKRAQPSNFPIMLGSSISLICSFIILSSISIKLFNFAMFPCNVDFQTIVPIASKITKKAFKRLWNVFIFIHIRNFSCFISYLITSCNINTINSVGFIGIFSTFFNVLSLSCLRSYAGPL